jgi:hypothetical protein
MDDKIRDLLARVLDMDEYELKSALIAIVNGSPMDEAIDAAFNVFRREAMKMKRLPK